ncbi:transcription antitermination protein NusB [Coleofasciculus sp. FACHB-712]|uniref:transcription antitermination factor NusB n=1 Tax=Cyanophyceae TaxID=3028117 RepID=UPI0016834D0A|nr:MULTISPECIES: transcription antitermination factor NusB [unclassified Coleofasciculus]MBD1888783.1 transcription antitermination protein NusB [Coleofasciculus sp. FACHB-SPT9]MBD1902457.1 transcription antitermination protein NusB [Coleofasciculus sp. FACHB-125]MBD1941108.1 transcription antitermination protein NusB [Coleofasciculus sp. FACHB-712]MBD2539324.1 transcription antitermination protein NusB [Coleofasciculus sp. FACHB-SPT36]
MQNRQPRRIARELALLSLSQLSGTVERLATQQISSLVTAAIRALSSEVQETLEVAAAEVQRSSERLLSSETRASDVQSAKVMINEAIELTQAAINRVGTALELPEFIQLSNQQEVRAYALEIITKVNAKREEIDQQLDEAMVNWQLNRLPRIDRDILRVAVVEIMYIGVPDRVAVNEAIELAKRYSDEEGHRFIQGVLRRVTDQLKAQSPTT